MRLNEKIVQLIESLTILPGVGRKTAERFVYHLLKLPNDKISKLSQDLLAITNQKFFCQKCHNLSDEIGLCSICRNPHRQQTVLCLVEDFQALLAIEMSGSFQGIYHVLGGKIDLAEGITPDNLYIADLEKRLKEEPITEIIFALNPDISGEGTILYLKNRLKNYSVQFSRLARGLPMGGDIEYADEGTISNALKGRQQL